MSLRFDGFGDIPAGALPHAFRDFHLVGMGQRLDLRTELTQRLTGLETEEFAAGGDEGLLCHVRNLSVIGRIAEDAP